MYLATMDLYGRRDPINHGLVEIDDQGFLSDGTPVEDYGMYILRHRPLPNDPEKLTRMFLWLLRRRDQ